MRAFSAAARHLNFRLAADEIGVTQGAVAQQVRGLEATLGVKLFDRLPRGLALTEEGRVFFTPIKRAFELIEQASESVRPRKTILSISVTPSFATKWLVPRLGDFTEANPDLDVRIVASEGLANFQSDGVDIAVRQGRPPFATGLVANLLFPLEISAVCSPSLLNGEHPLKTLQDLSHHVLLQDAHGLWPVFLEQVTGDASIKIGRTIRFNQTALAIDAAISGQGIALSDDVFVEDDIAAGRLCRPFDVSIIGEDGFYQIAARQSRNPKSVARMRDWLLTQSKSNRG